MTSPLINNLGYLCFPVYSQVLCSVTKGRFYAFLHCINIIFLVNLQMWGKSAPYFHLVLIIGNFILLFKGVLDGLVGTFSIYGESF